MKQNNLRTYRRRNVTRKSGFHTCDETTGSECIIVNAEKFMSSDNKEVFIFKRDNLQLVNLFKSNLGILCFGGYLFINKKVNICFDIQYDYNNEHYTTLIENKTSIDKNDWNNIGFHIEIPLTGDNILKYVIVKMTIESNEGNFEAEFVSFDFDSLNKKEFTDKTFEKSFHQKTNMCIPYLYYLNTEYSINKYLISDQLFSIGQYVVLKSCNRCGRFLPINIYNEINTLSFSLHCKKLAPCNHSAFRSYTIQNNCDQEEIVKSGINIEDGKVISYYGHQLECKACKKFFVNMPLNPQRNAQQFKEDGLRRRAIEVLINNLLKKNLIHFEFERKNKSEFSKYIWDKFNHKCFKCKKDLQLSEMNLDHTMPLAYLYRLDETATCLCASHNSQKSDHFPVDYYTEDELLELSKITGLSLEKLHSREINNQVLQLLVDNIVWFYDVFLMNPDYQKVRDGILTADKINDSLKRVIKGKVDLAEEYKKVTGHYPNSVTII